MNFNLISPDGEGQKFNVKFQEPIVIPPQAKIGLNFAQFERNGHFDFVEDQTINIGQDFYTQQNSIFPRMAMDTDGTTALKSIPFKPTPNTALNVDTFNQLKTEIIIPRGTYTFDALNRKINEEIFAKNFGIGYVNNVNEYFGSGNVPTIKQNACLSLYNQQILTEGLTRDTMVVGFYNNYDADEKSFGELDDMLFSSTHQKNATLTSRGGGSPNNYIPSGNSVSGDYESYVLGRNRIVHINNSYRGISSPSMNFNDSLEGKTIYDKIGMFRATLRDKVNDDLSGKDMIGIYSIDYAGLEDENHISLNGGTNGTGFSASNNNCRKGKFGENVASPADASVIQGANLELDSKGVGFKVPKLFFAVEFENVGGHNTISIYASTSILGLNDWRTNPIDETKLVFNKRLSDLHYAPPDLFDGELEVSIHFLSNANEKGGDIGGDYVNADDTDLFVYPIVLLRNPSLRMGYYCAFDGRFNTFPDESDKIGFSKKFLLGDLDTNELSGLVPTGKSISISTRGTDLPFAPLLTSTNTDGGFKNITGAFYHPQSGTINDANDPLRSNHILRYFKLTVSEELEKDLFSFTHKNERNREVVNNYPIYPLFDPNYFLTDVFFKGSVDSSYALVLNEIPHNYRNDAFNIHINLPIKSFSNTNEKNKSGIRKNILAHCPQIFASNITDDNLIVNGRKIITGGFAPSIGVVQHLDNMGIITTNNFEIELRNMNDDTPANQLFKSIVNFSIFS